MVGEVDGLEMFGFIGGGGDGDFFCVDEGVDGGRFVDVGVVDEIDLEFVFWVVWRVVSMVEILMLG